MVDMNRLSEIKAAILAAEEADEYDKADKLRVDRKRLLDADKVAEREAQKGARDSFAAGFQAAVGAVSIPKGTSLSVTLKRTDTGLDDLTVALGVTDRDALMGAVHDAISSLDVPTSVDGVKFVDGKAELTGRSARATGSGGGPRAGVSYMWQQAGGDAMKLDAAFVVAGGSKDDMIAVKDGEHITFASATGSQTWAHKKKLVQEAGFEQVVSEG